MLGTILYETANILFELGKLGYNCVEYSLGYLYGDDKRNDYRDEYIELYRKRLEQLESRLEQLEREKQMKDSK